MFAFHVGLSSPCMLISKFVFHPMYLCSPFLACTWRWPRARPARPPMSLPSSFSCMFLLLASFCRWTSPRAMPWRPWKPFWWPDTLTAVEGQIKLLRILVLSLVCFLEQYWGLRARLCNLVCKIGKLGSILELAFWTLLAPLSFACAIVLCLQYRFPGSELSLQYGMQWCWQDWRLA